jgi:hypothetical protein
MTTKRAWPLPKIAELLGISARHAFRLAAEDILPGKDGRYDPLECARAYIRHTSKDAEGRAARVELARVEARRKTLLMKRQLGELLTTKERATLDDGIFEGSWAAWQLAAATFFAELGTIVGLDPRERLRISNVCDQTGKSELIRFRDNWRDTQRNVRTYLHDPERIERLIGELSAAGEHAAGEHAEGKPDGDDQ